MPRIKFDTPAHRIRYLFTGSLLGATLGVIQLLSREVLPLLYNFAGSLYGAGKDSPSKAVASQLLSVSFVKAGCLPLTPKGRRPHDRQHLPRLSLVDAFGCRDRALVA